MSAAAGVAELRAKGVPASALAPLRAEGVLVELGRWGGSQPHTQAGVNSVLADHAPGPQGLGP